MPNDGSKEEAKVHGERGKEAVVAAHDLETLAERQPLVGTHHHLRLTGSLPHHVLAPADGGRPA